MLIDSHCHLDFAIFDSQRDACLHRASKQGVTHCLIAGVAAHGWSKIVALADEYIQLGYALGLHPCFLEQHCNADLVLLEKMLLANQDCLAVGEIGLDLFNQDFDLESQLNYLLPQFELAQQFNKPVILHVRKAHDQMLKQLRRYKLAKGGIVHAFAGSQQQAEQYLALGFKLGLGGAITYPRAQKLRRIVQALPLDSFVLETDSPDMPLCGYQGQVNYPERVRLVAEALAELRGESVEAVAAATTANVQQLLGWPPARTVAG